MLQRNQFENATDYKTIYESAIKYLSMSSHSISEVRKYLHQKGAASEISLKVINRLTELGFLNDEKYAQDFVRTRKELNHYGKYRIKMDLKHKGVNETIIDSVLAGYSDDDEYSMALELLQHKFPASEYNERNYRRAAQFLARKGIALGLINKLLHQHFKQSPTGME
jgi:regulatory protein